MAYELESAGVTIIFARSGQTVFNAGSGWQIVITVPLCFYLVRLGREH